MEETRLQKPSISAGGARRDPGIVSQRINTGTRRRTNEGQTDVTKQLVNSGPGPRKHRVTTVHLLLPRQAALAALALSSMRNLLL